MVDLTQRDLPYLVLTEDPYLTAYRTDRVTDIERACPKPNGDPFCQQVSYEPMLAIAPAEGGDDGGGSSAGIFVAIGVVVLALLGFVFVRRRRGGGREPLELET
jgi:LPXTG-motif cell wall-anchored protein